MGMGRRNAGFGNDALGDPGVGLGAQERLVALERENALLRERIELLGSASRTEAAAEPVDGNG